jgi:hypothetical protein
MCFFHPGPISAPPPLPLLPAHYSFYHENTKMLGLRERFIFLAHIIDELGIESKEMVPRPCLTGGLMVRLVPSSPGGGGDSRALVHIVLCTYLLNKKYI